MTNMTRRKYIVSSLAILGTIGATGWFKKNSILKWILRNNNNEGLELSAAPKLSEDFCVLTSSQAEGPYFISSPIRRDIKENKKGKELNLKFEIIRMPDCTPIEGAIVEIWHCDAEGIYSGYSEDLAHNPWETLKLAGMKGSHVEPMNETRFLRGAQETDANGQVEFNTIFPGWYDPRSPHIHVKVLIDKEEHLNTQLYFKPDFTNRMYLHQEPYITYGESPYTPQNDVVFSENLQAEGLLLNPRWNDNLPLEASAKIGIKKSV